MQAALRRPGRPYPARDPPATAQRAARPKIFGYLLPVPANSGPRTVRVPAWARPAAALAGRGPLPALQQRDPFNRPRGRGECAVGRGEPPAPPPRGGFVEPLQPIAPAVEHGQRQRRQRLARRAS
jgi:hypothetical protein